MKHTSILYIRQPGLLRVIIDKLFGSFFSVLKKTFVTNSFCFLIYNILQPPLKPTEGQCLIVEKRKVENLSTLQTQLNKFTSKFAPLLIRIITLQIRHHIPSINNQHNSRFPLIVLAPITDEYL